jgi:hypothetical protein
LIIGLGSSTWLFFKERESRREAEQGRANEALLRRQAEVREKISQAAVLVGQSRFAEADQLAAGIPIAETALEGSTVFRSLGDWAAVQKRWPRAAAHFATLLRVDQIETFGVSTLDYTRCAVALIEVGDSSSYEQFRQAAIKQFGGTGDPVVAERTVKNCLLVPADDSLLTALAPLTEIAAKSLAGGDPTVGIETSLAPWRCVSLALMELRRKNFSDSIEWCNRCLAFGNDIPVRVATARAILALSYHRLGRATEARAELTQSRAIIEDKFKGDLDVGDGGQGFWFDWLLGQILLREAAVLIGEPN